MGGPGGGPAAGGPAWLLLALGGAAALIALALTPLARLLAIRLHMADKPGGRRVQAVEVPRGGGLAIFAAWLFVLGVTLASGVFPSSGPGRPPSDLWALLAGAALAFVTGWVDDRWGLRPGAKLAGLVAAAAVSVALGLRIEFLTNPFGGMVYLGLWGLPLTALWLLAVSNAVNLIDGLDGLAAGVVFIACIPVAGVALQRGQLAEAALTAALAGAALGFLPYNLHPARVFMGDSGALFLGFALAGIAVSGALKGPATLALLVPAVSLGIPALDTGFAILRRLRAQRPIGEADRGHLHHRLLDKGFSQRQAVSVLYLLTAALGVVAFSLNGARPWQAAVLLGALAAAGVLFGLWLGAPEPPGGQAANIAGRRGAGRGRGVRG